MRDYIDVTGKNEDEAISKALAQLNLDRDDVSVEVLERAKSGFLGLGACPAKIRVYYGPEAEEEILPPPPPPQTGARPGRAPQAPARRPGKTGAPRAQGASPPGEEGTPGEKRASRPQAGAPSGGAAGSPGRGGGR